MTQNSSCQAVLPAIPKHEHCGKKMETFQERMNFYLYSLPLAECEKPYKKAVCEDTHSWEGKNFKRLRVSKDETWMFVFIVLPPTL